MKLKPFIFTALALAFIPNAIAETGNEKPQTNLVSFSTEAEQEVERDLLRVTMFYQAEGNDLTVLNQTISAKLNQAVNIVKQHSDVEIKQNQRFTNVRYVKGKQTGWQTKAELTLESKDSVAMSKTIADLDNVLAIENVQSLVSSEKLASLETSLTQQALAKFTAKADLIKQSLQMKGYRLVELEIGEASAEFDGSRMYNVAASRSAETEGEQNADFKQGKQKVKARVTGKIELLKE